MNKHHPTSNNSPGDRDHFELINGIGENIAKALYRSGIRHFAELALFTPEELAERVSEIIPIAPVQRIKNENWIGQARELARKKFKPVSPKSISNGVREIANFTVSFEQSASSEGQTALQIKINHEQSDEDKEFDLETTDSLIQWMLAKANLSAPPASKTSYVKSVESACLLTNNKLEEEIELALSDLWVSQATKSLQLDTTAAQSVVRIDGKLTIGGQDALELTHERAPFIIDFSITNLEDNRSQIVATLKGQLEPNNLDYPFQQDFLTPERGQYQLDLTAHLCEPFTANTHLSGPILRVGVQ